MFEEYDSLNKADWFDSDCSDCESARRLYIDALKCFNLNKSDASRSMLCHYKKLYKNLMHFNNIYINCIPESKYMKIYESFK